MTIQVAHGLVEVIRGLYIGEAYRASRGSRGRRWLRARVAGSVPLHKRLIGAVGCTIIVITGSPHIVGRCHRCLLPAAGGAGQVGTGHDAPTAPVPVLYQRLVAFDTGIISHSPHIVS